MFRSATSIFYLAISIFTVFNTGNLLAQPAEKDRTNLKLSYEKDYNNDKKLKVLLTSGKGKNMKKIADAMIVLSSSANDSTAELTEIKTDKNGKAELYIMAGYHFRTDKDGFTIFSASFKGNDLYKASSAEITAKDLAIEIDPEVVDSVKTVNVYAYEIESDGKQVPVEGLEIIVGVERLFSSLQIGQVQTDVGGRGKIEFPNDLPGDSSGLLNVNARIEDHEFYGTVGTRKTMPWGLPVSYEVKPLTRQLWSNEAPLWMIISVFIVLSATWFHFGLAIVRIARIKKAKNPSPAI